MEEVLTILKLVWPIVFIQVALTLWAVFDILRIGRTKNLNKYWWLGIVVIVNTIGAIGYFLIGKAQE